MTTYPVLPANGIPYHIDGTVVKVMKTNGTYQATLSASEAGELNDEDLSQIPLTNINTACYVIFFFPELRNIVAMYGLVATSAGGPWYGPDMIEGSANSTNGLDGNWVSASAPSGLNNNTRVTDSWRKGGSGGEGWQFTALSSVNVVRVRFTVGGTSSIYLETLHLYGDKKAGQTPDDILFLDAEAGDAPFTANLDFGDRPAGTSFTRQIKIQNSSLTKTANDITVSCVHADWLISWDEITWATSLDAGDLIPEAKSPIIYVKNTTPPPPTTLGPKRVCITVQVVAWTT